MNREQRADVLRAAAKVVEDGGKRVGTITVPEAVRDRVIGHIRLCTRAVEGE